MLHVKNLDKVTLPGIVLGQTGHPCGPLHPGLMLAGGLSQIQLHYSHSQCGVLSVRLPVKFQVCLDNSVSIIVLYSY